MLLSFLCYHLDIRRLLFVSYVLENCVNEGLTVVDALAEKLASEILDSA